VGSLGLRAVRGAAIAVLGVVCLGMAAGAVRLLPWLAAPEVPLPVALPFARALGAAATETALLVGLPLGAAVVMASITERGEARALYALGLSPLRLALGVAPWLAAFALAVAGASLAWGSSAAVPGRFAADLVAQGKASCAGATEPRSAEVPLVGVTWLCFPGQPPRVAGPLPGLRGTAWFTALDFAPSDDLRRADLTELRVFTRKLGDAQRLELQVRSATVRGLPGWGRSAKLGVVPRALLGGLTALLLSFGASLAVARLGISRRVAALAVGGLPAVASLVALSRVDGSAAGAAAYALVPAAGLLALGLASVAARSVERLEGALGRRVARPKPR
jgi:hypothetical protein